VRHLVVVFFVALLAGCQASQDVPETRLTVVALNSSVGRAVFHLDCRPDGGDLANAGRACAALKQTPALVTDPQPFTCGGGTFSWWDVTISGELDKRPIRRSFSTCWTPQMETIGRLGLSWSVLKEHLLPRRRESVVPGQPRVFPPGVLRATDLVTCDILGHHLELGVPVGTGSSGRASAGYGGDNVVDVTLSLGRNRDGSVRADCHIGNS